MPCRGRVSPGSTRRRTTPTVPSRSALSTTCGPSGTTQRRAVAEHFNCSEWLVDRHVEAGHGARTALHCGDAAITYEELLNAVRAASGGLRGLGVRPEERVVMILR